VCPGSVGVSLEGPLLGRKNLNMHGFLGPDVAQDKTVNKMVLYCPAIILYHRLNSFVEPSGELSGGQSYTV
jgi:hypothetical protein